MRKIIKNVSDARDKMHKLDAIHHDICKEKVLVWKDESIVLADFDHAMYRNGLSRWRVMTSVTCYRVYRANTRDF